MPNVAKSSFTINSRTGKIQHVVELNPIQERQTKKHASLTARLFKYSMCIAAVGAGWAYVTGDVEGVSHAIRVTLDVIDAVAKGVSK